MTTMWIDAHTHHDKASWAALFLGYQSFYEVPNNPDVIERVWEWIHYLDHQTECLLARKENGRPIGLAHFRNLARPLSGTQAGFIDDLFVELDSRGSGAADALVNTIAEIGRERGWSWLHWFTAEDNYRGRGFYERVAHANPWKTYQVNI
jgi:GNAT superfamily N-acetyltransferase